MSGISHIIITRKRNEIYEEVHMTWTAQSLLCVTKF